MGQNNVPILESPAEEVCYQHTYVKYVKENEEFIVELSYSNESTFDYPNVFKCGIYYDCHKQVSN